MGLQYDPGSFHDITAARLHALPALYAAVADVGYNGVGPVIQIPAKQRRNHPPLDIMP